MLDEVAGTLVFTGERSHAGYRLNRMAMSLTDAANRAALVADEWFFQNPKPTRSQYGIFSLSDNDRCVAD